MNKEDFRQFEWYRDNNLIITVSSNQLGAVFLLLKCGYLFFFVMNTIINMIKKNATSMV